MESELRRIWKYKCEPRDKRVAHLAECPGWRVLLKDPKRAEYARRMLRLELEACRAWSAFRQRVIP